VHRVDGKDRERIVLADWRDTGHLLSVDSQRSTAHPFG
jgi:hypothetical protein